MDLLALPSVGVGREADGWHGAGEGALQPDCVTLPQSPPRLSLSFQLLTWGDEGPLTSCA